MTLNDLLDNEQSIISQDIDIGIPSYEELRQSPNTCWIDSYTYKNGKKIGDFYGSILDNSELMLPTTNSYYIDKDRCNYVHAYNRDDGAEVKGHWRSKPEGTNAENKPDNKVKYEKINQNEQGSVTGGASYTNDMDIKEKVQEYAYEKGLSKIFPMSSVATINGMHNMEAAKMNKNATVTSGLDAIDSQKK